MNKSNNLASFKEALNQQQFPNLSIIYADKKGNILDRDNSLEKQILDKLLLVEI